jgi:hypothetical protein
MRKIKVYPDGNTDQKRNDTELNEKINIEIDALSSIEQIKHKWNYIYSNAEENFFLSWNWINPWLRSTLNNFNAYVCVATINNNPIGIAIFTEVMSSRYKILSTKQWWLHKTGNEKHDQIWIEQNDFLLDKRYASLTRAAMWSVILEQKPNIDEFIIGMSNHETIQAHQLCLPEYLKWDFIESTGWSAEVENWPDFESYWKSRSKSFRNQINRTDKILTAQKANISINTDNITFQEGLKIAEPWHKNHWGTESGFENDLFIKHFTLMSNMSDENNKSNLFILTIQLDNAPIAVCLGFYTSTTLYFYLSAQEKIKDNKIKIGLYLHYLAIKWCFQNKVKCYDFLAGDYRYKRSFADKPTYFYLSHFQRNTFKFKIENQLKLLKSKIAHHFRANSSQV